MSVRKLKALILAGDGLTCQEETSEAFRLAGFEIEIQTINELARNYTRVDALDARYAVVAIPSGESFGGGASICGGGKILAMKIQNALQWDLALFCQRGGLVLGIGNGFQTLIRLGLFGKDVTVTLNPSGNFLNRWERVVPQNSGCVWLKGAGTLELPLRVREGRVVFGRERRKEVLSKMQRAGMICLRYDVDPTGSEEAIAGLSDSTGRIFGVMPQPEAFVRWTAYSEWTAEPGRATSPGQGLLFFENAFRAAVEAR